MSGGGRIAQASLENLFGSVSATQATVTLTAPNQGFVLVQGSIVASDVFVFPRCNPCTVSVVLHDVNAGVDSPKVFSSLGNGVNEEYVTVPVQWVFPVTAGNHTYTLMTGQFGIAGPAGLFNPVLTAEFIPFGHSGSSTTLALPGENTVASPKHTVGG
jgi:hypothetical protein